MAERLLRAALCVVTPFIALLAVAMTHRATIMLVLPIAAGAVLASKFPGDQQCRCACALRHPVPSFSALLAGTFACNRSMFILVLRRLSGRFVRSNGLSLISRMRAMIAILAVQSLRAHAALRVPQIVIVTARIADEDRSRCVATPAKVLA
jgi:hypothetical protein